ncbi:MAG: DNA topoisomerase 3 [Mycobacterium leprae]
MTTARKPLIIAEKPSAAMAIAEALGGFSRREGYMESDGYYLSWAIGHLVELLDPEEYDPKWKRWSLESLPIMPVAFGLKVAPRTKSQFSVLMKLAKQASDLINACDAAREGELIFRYICDAGKIRLPARRLWVSALTREGIRRAFAGLRPEEEYDRLYQSALCRAQGDWLVGMNGTRAFTVKWGELYSIGRVQTPTLAMLVKREREIEAFVPEPFWQVSATFLAEPDRTYTGRWFDKTGDRLKSAAAAEAVVTRVKGQKGQVESVEQKPVAEKPPQLFDLTSLQREANRRFGLTAAATLKAAQSLYEAKLITYPRTDSRYLNRDLVKVLPKVVESLGGTGQFRELAAGADLGLVGYNNFRVVNDSKVTDHHAIIPTREKAGSLSAVEAKIYDLIARRFLAQFYPEARYLETEVITAVGALPDRFRTRGRQMLEPGWHVVEPEPPRKREEQEEEAESRLPKLTAHEPVATRKVEAQQKETQPPKRFNEASLLSAMEFAGKEMTDDALKEAMKGHGLGTPATRAAIIERLKDVGYITLSKKMLVPTEKGKHLVDLAEAAGAQVLLSPELTGEWEKRIADIQSGEYDPIRFLTEVRELTAQVVQLTRNAPGGAARGDGGHGRQGAQPMDADGLPLTAGKCPRCGRTVIRGKKDWACVNEDCTIRIPSWLCGKVIDQQLAGSLLKGGRTELITGFKSPRTGNTFSAYLVLKEGQVAFEFPPDRRTKPRGYRATTPREETSGVERTAATKTRSRKTGSRTGSKAGTTGTRRSGTGVGRGRAGASKSAGTGATPD